MNNQAAQTMPLPPSLPEWSRMDDLGGVVPSEVRQALIAMYQQGYAAALSQTAGVAQSITRPVESGHARWCSAKEGAGCSCDYVPEKKGFTHSAAAAPAASGGESAESVSELARGYHQHDAIEFAVRDLGYSPADAARITAAIEQALTKQRGEQEPIAWFSVSGYGGSLFVSEHKESVERWITEQNKDQDRRRVSPGYRHTGPFPLIDGRATPQPSADAVREVVKRILNWKPLTSINKADRLYQILIAAGIPFESVTDELESLLSAASGEKGVG